MTKVLFYPHGISEQLRLELLALDRAFNRYKGMITQYELLWALGREGGFGERHDNQPHTSSLNVINAVLIHSLCLSLCALHGQGADEVDLHRIINALIHPRDDAAMREWHRSMMDPQNTDVLKARLIALHRLSRSPRFEGRRDAIRHYRNMDIAHLQRELKLARRQAHVRDLDWLMIMDARLLVTAMRYGLGKSYDIANIRRIAMASAQAFAAKLDGTN